MKYGSASFLAFALPLVTDCSTTDVIVKGTTKITTGQELVDLQRALDQGAMTPNEFGE